VRLGRPHRRSPTAGAAVAFIAVVASQLIEVFINRVLRPDAKEWTWISETVVVAGFLVVTPLWLQLRQAREALGASERARLAVETQLSVAAEVQRALLPAIPAPMADVQWWARVEPAGKIGGDYYDFLRLSQTQMFVVVGDVSGKGIPAAIFLSNVRAIVRALVRETLDPADVVTRLSQAVQDDSNGHLYLTCILGIVDTNRRTLTYLNAGHPSGVLIGPTGVVALNAGGPPAGLLPSAVYRPEEISFRHGDFIVFVSDGVTDALDLGGDGIAPGLASILLPRRPASPREACERLLSAARSGPGPTGVPGWNDDRTVLAFGVW
jgi:phosphoserine phosphatase RsbU/P